MKFSPRQHQLELKKAILESKGNGVIGYHGMGLGKTFTALITARELIADLSKKFRRDSIKVIVICPKSALITWRHEIGQQAPDLINNIILTTFSSLHQLVKRLEKTTINIYAMLIVDECHYLKNPEAERTRTFTKLLDAIAPYFYGKCLPMTGTPTPNNGAEIYTSFWLVSSPNLSQASTMIKDIDQFQKFRDIFTIKEQKRAKRRDWTSPSGFSFMNVVSFKALQNEDKFYQLINPFCHYRRIEDCIDMPEKNIVNIRLDIPDDALLKGANMEMPDAYMSKLERIATAKTPTAIAWIEEFIQTGEQLVVFSMFTKGLRIIEQHFKGQVKLITGAESQVVRSQTIQAFQNKQIQVIALSFGAGAESLNLQNANNSLYINFPWNDDKLAQAMARTYRGGQSKKTNHYFLFSGENDETCFQRVLDKRAFNEGIRESLLTDNSPQEIKREEKLWL
jgi:SNF2 family DNA or RNA helicase